MKFPDGVSEQTQTTPEDAKKFVEETFVDLFAPSVGNITRPDKYRRTKIKY